MGWVPGANATQVWTEIIYVFGATSFSSTTFAGVGIQNVVVLANGNRVNIAIGNTELALELVLLVTDLKLALGTVSVVSWNPIDPNAGQTWVPIDPLNPYRRIMASTYSSNLKLELMTTGEKSGTWGTITNTNLQQLEQASSGYISIDSSIV